MHRPINVKSPNNTSKWQMGFNSAFKGLSTTLATITCPILISRMKRTAEMNVGIFPCSKIPPPPPFVCLSREAPPFTQTVVVVYFLILLSGKFMRSVWFSFCHASPDTVNCFPCVFSKVIAGNTLLGCFFFLNKLQPWVKRFVLISYF